MAHAMNRSTGSQHVVIIYSTSVHHVASPSHPSFTTLTQVEENYAALTKGPLGAAQTREINTLLGR